MTSEVLGELTGSVVSFLSWLAFEIRSVQAMGLVNRLSSMVQQKFATVQQDPKEVCKSVLCRIR